MEILFSGSETAADMTFSFIVIKNFFYFRCKAGIYFLEPFGDIFMYCRFRNTEFSSCAPDGSTGFDDIMSKLKNSLFYIVFHFLTVHHLILD